MINSCPTPPCGNPHLPDGAQLIPLSMHQEPRGIFTEVFRESWDVVKPPVQWNVVRSNPTVLRGVHVHHTHWDFLIILDGEALIQLHDMRVHSPSYTNSCSLSLSGTKLQALVIPPGVAHGFYFSTSAVHLYSVSSYWDTADELGCRFDDPALNISWPNCQPILSPRDATLGDYQVLSCALAPHQERLMPPDMSRAANS
jgi:dTDP-4-dehydrorhamnose 3,5-epimerase